MDEFDEHIVKPREIFKAENFHDIGVIKFLGDVKFSFKPGDESVLPFGFEIAKHLHANEV